VPTAHDEPAIKLGIFRDVFTKPLGLIYNTEAEKDLTASLFSPNQLQQVAGIGIDAPQRVDRHAFRRQQGLMQDYFYYGGRIDAGKGCQEMIDFYLRKKQQNAELPKLMLSGHLSMDLPRDPSVVYLGYLPEAEKNHALQGAMCTLIPSVMESLSIVLLESLAGGTPVLVREGSPVLKSHCIKSNAGLYYNDYDDFSACLDYLMEHPRTRHQMGINGQRYVRNNYSWPRVLTIYEQVLSQNSGY
jgi:glycosyltransferase involved in cell wall biosynthesis